MSAGDGDYAILISLSMREEAEVVAAALRADGIDAFIGNSNHAYFDWHYTIALGGLQVYVPRGSIGEATDLLTQRIRENADAYPDERVSRRDRWKLWLVILLLYGGNLLYMLMISWWWEPQYTYHFMEWVEGLTAPMASY